MSAEEVSEAQSPHEADGAQHAARLPAPPGGAHLRAQARGAAEPLHALAELDVLHERDLGKPGERLPAHEQRLVTRGDATQARANVHGEADQAEERRTP